MTSALLNQIEEAEHKADEVRMASTREARDMIKSVEEAIAIEARQAARQLHEEQQRVLENARISINDEIRTLEVRRDAQREAMREAARARVAQAGQTIFERVVNVGNR